MKYITTNLLLLFAFVSLPSVAQQLTQTIRGVVVDQVSQAPLPGATIVIQNSEPLKGTISDKDGNFRLEEVPAGKHTLEVRYLGYEDALLSNITVNTAKEVVLRIQLKEKVITGKEVVISAHRDREKPVNELAVVSSRSFSVEETQKYAAAVNDPGRMALSFSGVVSTDDGNNMISIRGNTPNGLLWRMEGVEIPNPNHFAEAGTAGGGISILSSQLLGNSDFMTSAFPAEYGNALSGVFDLRLRRGNNEKHEHTFQAGILGIDLASEGPFKKGYEGSYLVNYRYSTLNVLEKIGFNLTGASTNFQDLSWNVNLPAGKAGNFSFFGFGGLSHQFNKVKLDTAAWKGLGDNFQKKFYSNTGMAGLSHTILTGKNGNIKTVLAMSGTDQGYHEDRFDSSYFSTRWYHESYIQDKITLSSTLTHKFNSRHSLKAGAILNRIHYSVIQQIRASDSGQLRTFMDASGSTYTLQSFAHYSFRVNEKLSLHTGVHALAMMLNKTFSPEPRASVKYAISDRKTVGAGYGLHSQVQPLGVYFAESLAADGTVHLPNRDLDLTKSHHVVAFYDQMITQNLHLKTEVYYQSLFDIPVAADSSATSIINNVYGYLTDPMVGRGTGRNYGIEFTLERFLHRDYYFLVSASFYDSKYQALDGKLRNTRYNGNFAGTFTAGKEFLVGKAKNRVLGLNLKAIYAGGQRYTPFDESTLIAGQWPRYDEERVFDPQLPTYFRTDLRVSLKKNREKSTSTIALDIQNLSNRQNVGGITYNPETAQQGYWYQVSLLPVLSYKIEF